MTINNSSPKAVVITPTIGTLNLVEAIESVQNQHFEDLIHLIVIDGEEHKENTYEILKGLDLTKCKIVVLPFNTGQNGFNGHRIYAAFSYLINSEYVFYLDEDNWYDTNHVSSLIELIETENLDWAYSLRKICGHDSEFITTDDCDSLGKWPPFYHPTKLPHSMYPNLVDTSCYAIKRKTLLDVGHTWNHPLGADRIFFKHLSTSYPNFSSSSQYTLNYRLHENRYPAGSDYIKTNALMLEKYDNELPWLV